MKRHISALAAAAASVMGFTAAAVTVLPETTPATLREYPLDPGAVAVVPDTATGGAEVYIGGADGTPLRARDPAALRGSRLLRLAAGEYSVAASPGFSPGTNGAWRLEGAASGSLTVSAETPLGRLDYLFDFPVAPSPNVPKVEEVRLAPNAIRLDVALNGFDWGEIQNLTPRALAFGDRPVTNDLADVTYRMKDELGVWDLKDLRPWAKHLYDGNRGADWARYPATNTANLAGQRLIFDGNGRYAAQFSDTNLVVSAGGAPALEVVFRGVNLAPEGHLRFTGVKVTAADVTLSVGCDIDGFDPALLTLLTRPALDSGEWAAVAGAALSPSNTYTVARDPGGMALFKLSYDADPATANTTAIDFKVTPTANGRPLALEYVTYATNITADRAVCALELAEGTNTLAIAPRNDRAPVDFILDVSNPSGTNAVAFAAASGAIRLAFPKGETRSSVLSFKPGETARLYVTETALGAFLVTRQDIAIEEEDGQ